METFKQKLAALIGEDRVEVVCELVKTDVIGLCELNTLPRYADEEEEEQWKETVVRNELRREQYRRMMGVNL